MIMPGRRWFALIVILCSLAGGERAQAELVPYLDTIGWGELTTDGRFSALTRSGGLNQGLAVFDTGIDPLHQMFDSGTGSRVVGGEDFIGAPLAPIATPDTPWADGHMHGTFVAALAAGNQTFTAPLVEDLVLDGQTFAAGTELEHGGVARGSDLLALRVLGNSGFGDGFFATRDALNWVIEHHETYDIRVLNLSLGSAVTFEDEDELYGDPIFHEIADAIATLRSLDIPVIIASGNSGADDGLSFPAIIEDAISVGASMRDPDDLTQELIADFSNRNDQLDLMAPGVDTPGALPRWFTGDATDSWGVAEGTSNAAPQVAGAVLLINEVFEDYWGRRPTYDEIYEYLTYTDTTITDAETGETFPRLNLVMALERATTQGGTQTPNISVWTGAGNETWGNANNWVDGTPGAGQQLMFTGLDTNNAQNTLAPGTSFESIIFATSAEAFTLSGNDVAIEHGGSIRNQSPLVQTVDLNIDADGDMSIIANAGLLSLEGDVHLPSGTLTFTGDHQAAVSGAITGSGDLVLDGPSLLTLSGANTYTGGTDIQQGLLASSGALPDTGRVTLSGGADAALALGADETIGALAGSTGSVVALDGHTLTVGDGSNTTFAGSIIGRDGTLEKQGGGTLRLTGESGYTGATRVLAGTLVAADQASNLADTTPVHIAANATFELDGADETIAAVRNVQGDGGTVQINGNRLTLAGGTDSLFAGVIDGAGGVSFAGSGSTVHDLSDATLQYAGTTRIFGGRVLFPEDHVHTDLENHATFVMDGTIDGDVLNHGRFGGNVTIDGRFTNAEGGVLAPGQSIGTTTVDGDFEALAGSVFEVEVEGAETEGGTFADTRADLLKVNANGGDPGEATFRSGSLIRFTRLEDGNLVQEDNVFLIVDAEGGVTLEEGAHLVSWSRFVQFSLDPNFNNGDNQLLVTTSLSAFFRDLARDADHNTRQIAAALDSLGMEDEDDPLIDAIFTLLDDVGLDQEQDVFLSLAPSVGPQAYDATLPVITNNATLMNNVVARHHAAKRLGVPGLAMSRNNDGPFLETALASAGDSPWMFRETIDARERSAQRTRRPRFDDEPERNWSVFAYALRGSQDQDTTDDRLGYDATAYGFLAGFDYNIADHLDAGLSIGYTRTEIDLHARRGDQEIGTLRVGPQISYSPMPWFIDAAATYGYHRLDTERRMPDLDMSTESRHSGHDVSVFARGGYQFQFNRLHLTPTASLEYLYLYEEGHTERGDGALVIDSRDNDSLRSRLALTLDYRFEVDDIRIIPEVSAGWEREYLADDGTTRARFVAGGESFTTNIAERETDVLFYSAGLGVLFDRHLAGYFRYDGRRYSSGDTHAFTLGASVRF